MYILSREYFYNFLKFVKFYMENNVFSLNIYLINLVNTGKGFIPFT